MMNRLRDMSLKIPLAESSGRRLALELPFFAVDNKNARSMKRSKDVTGECTTYIVLAIVLLNVLEVGGVIDDMQTEKRDSHLVGWSVSLIEGIPGLAASFAVGLELL